MDENELREIEVMAAYLDENTSLFCLGWSEELPIMDFVTKLYNAGCRIMPTGSVVLKVGKHNEALDEKTIEFFVKHNAKVRKEAKREILTRLWAVLVRDGEQFVAGEIRKIAEESGIDLQKPVDKQ